MNSINMKRMAVATAALAAALPVFGAAEKPETPQKKTERREIRIVRSQDEKDAPKVKAAFLGVATAPVPPPLSAQLDLPSDSGLVVSVVVPDSPAAGVLRQHDILVKLDDQILIDTRQLAVLVRRHKGGDQVSITFIRGGKEQTARITLKEQDMPPLPPAGEFHGSMGPQRHIEILREGLNGGVRAGSGIGMAHPLPRDEAGRMLGMFHGMPHDPVGMIEGRPGETMRRVFVHPGRSRMLFKDDEGTLELGIEDNVRQLIAKDADGKQLFKGPISTAEQRKALPEALRTRLEKLEKMEGVNFDRLERLNTGGPNWESKVDQLFRVPAPVHRQGVNAPAI